MNNFERERTPERSKEELKSIIMKAFGMDKWDEESRIKLFGKDDNDSKEYTVQAANRRMFEAILRAYGYNNTYQNALIDLQIIPPQQDIKPIKADNKENNDAYVVRDTSKKELYINGKTVLYDIYNDNKYYTKCTVGADNTVTNYVRVKYNNPLNNQNMNVLVPRDYIIQDASGKSYVEFIRDISIEKPKNTVYNALLERGNTTLFKEVSTKNDVKSFITTHKNGLIVIGTDGCSGCINLHNELTNKPLDNIPTVFLDTDGKHPMKRDDAYIQELQERAGRKDIAFPIVIAFNDGRYTLIDDIYRDDIDRLYKIKTS